LDQLNQIPPGFRNNLCWHVGHVIVTQQLLMYKNSGLPTKVPSEIINGFRKGTQPDGKIGPEAWSSLTAQLRSTVNEVWQDYHAGVFANYEPYPTSYGYQLNDIEDAIAFNNVHEGLHLGHAQAMRHLVK
jgi:hypothetical protein